jgi:hypothetical protein
VALLIAAVVFVMLYMGVRGLIRTIAWSPARRCVHNAVTYPPPDVARRVREGTCPCGRHYRNHNRGPEADLWDLEFERHQERQAWKLLTWREKQAVHAGKQWSWPEGFVDLD